MCFGQPLWAPDLILFQTYRGLGYIFMMQSFWGTLELMSVEMHSEQFIRPMFSSKDISLASPQFLTWLVALANTACKATVHRTRMHWGVFCICRAGKCCSKTSKSLDFSPHYFIKKKKRTTKLVKSRQHIKLMLSTMKLKYSAHKYRWFAIEFR